MTKAEAIYKFFSSFELLAYDETSVPTGDEAPTFPYLTYEYVEDDFDNELTTSLSLWYRSSSWSEINAKTEQISRYIGRGGRIVPCEGGGIWIKRGSPFAQSMGDDSDNMIRRKYINLTVEYITAD